MKKNILGILRFVFTFTVIFTIAFSIMNFSSVKSLVFFYFIGEEKQKLLNTSTGEDVTTVPLPPKGAKKLIEKEFPPLSLYPTPIDYRLIIPKTATNVPLIDMPTKYATDDLWGKFEKEVQAALRNGVVHYPGTAYPGQVGNVFFTGHSSYYPWDKGQYKDVFANLNQLDVGDEYVVFYNQEKYIYKIAEKKEVRPSQVGVLEQAKDKKLSTLMTCWPLGTTLKRLILVAEEV